MNLSGSNLDLTHKHYYENYKKSIKRNNPRRIKIFQKRNQRKTLYKRKFMEWNKNKRKWYQGMEGTHIHGLGSGTSFQQILWLISPKKGHLSRYQWDADGNIKQKECHADGFDTGQYGLKLFYEHNKDAGLDIEKYFPFKEVNRMRKAYRRLPVETKVKMATDTTHKLAMGFLAKYGIKPKNKALL